MLRLPQPGASAWSMYVRLSFCLLTLGAGCSSQQAGPVTSAVRGRVTLDGKPLDQALIAFVPIDDTVGPRAVGLIEFGEYSLEPPQGPMAGSIRVEITRVPEEDEPLPGQTFQGPKVLGTPIPARYNSQSQLKATIQEGENDGVDFQLTTVP